MDKATKKAQEVIYHFTCEFNLARILQAGYLAAGGANFCLGKPMPPVVWLTTSPTSENMGVSFGKSKRDEFDKTQVRLTIMKKPYMKNWVEWCAETGREQEEKDLLIYTASAEETHKTWYISEQDIPFADIVKIENMATGKEIPMPKLSEAQQRQRVVSPIDEYILKHAGIRQIVLANTRQAIRYALPKATENLNDNIPAFFVQGKVVIAFSVAKEHVDVHVGMAAIEHFASRLTDYKIDGGIIQFPYIGFGSKPMQLIAEIAAWCGNNRLEK